MTVSDCSVCQPSTSPISSTYDMYPWGRCTSSPSSSSAVWFFCGPSRHPGLPLCFLWWSVNSAFSSHSNILVGATTFRKTRREKERVKALMHMVENDLWWCIWYSCVGVVPAPSSWNWFSVSALLLTSHAVVMLQCWKIEEEKKCICLYKPLSWNKCSKCFLY